MATAKLTKRSVDALVPAAVARLVYDTELKGFGVRVSPSGVKSWFIEYRPAGAGRRVSPKRMTLGRVGTLTPEEARTAARNTLSAIRLGSDPVAERKRGQNAPSVAQLLERFLAEEVRPKLKASTAATYTHYIRNLIVPQFGLSKAGAVTKADVARLHRGIGEKHPTTANRVLAVLSSAYGFGGSHEIVPEGFNPTRGVKKFAEQSRERFLSSEELQRLGAALREAETVGLPWQVADNKRGAKHLARAENRRTKINPAAAAALRLLLFTGCRLREVLHLRWSEVDFERGMLFLPDSKTGKKPVILNAPALAILDALPRSDAYVIPGEISGKARSDLKRPWEAIARRAGLEGVRLHDLRHSFASVPLRDNGTGRSFLR